MDSGNFTSRSKALSRSFYQRYTPVVAFELIGKILVFKQKEALFSARIVETEAYLGHQDPASHAYRGVTPRNRVMFGPPGVSYVYFTYGNHHCLNVVTEEDGTAGAVLIRALEPISGIEVMTKRRGQVKLEALTSGPGKLTQAFGITREHSGLNLTQAPFYIAEGDREESIPVRADRRIGISQAKELLFRFYWLGNKFVSVNS
jgi:DNA-3-methyladenine glycosylase